MFRIDSVGATSGGQFKEAPLPATRVSADWLNAVQMELERVIVDLGATPLDKGNSHQLRDAIAAYVNYKIGTALQVHAGSAGQFAIGGIIVKWGGGTEGNVLFENAYEGATAFPNACWRVYFALTNDPDDGDESDETVRVTYKAANGFTVVTSGDHIPATFDWLAIGN
ncbi:MAG: hypothetical protein AB7E60_10270 [Sphingobium sp.]